MSDDLKQQLVNKGLERLVASKNTISLFKGMEDEDIKLIVKDVGFMRFNQHEVIIKELDESGDEIYFIVNGECRVSVGRNNVGVLSPNQVFGEFAPLTKEKRAASIKANKPTVVMVFKLAMELADEHPKVFMMLFRNIINGLIKKIDQANQKRY